MASKHKSVLVGFSGGKDSLVVMDLCCRAFERVVGFHMYMVPGLQLTQDLLDQSRKRWQVEFITYPDFNFVRWLRNGVFCPESLANWDLPKWSWGDIYDLARSDTGIQLVAWGGKKADSPHRRQTFSNLKDRNLFSPLKDWTKWDVLSYLKMHKIPIPEPFGKEHASNAMGLTTDCLLWLHDKHYPDFRKVCDYFPYAEAVVYRREWYGIS